MMDLKSQLFVFTPDPKHPEMRTVTYCIDYMNVNGERWCSKFRDGQFWHYRDGQKNEMLHGPFCYKNADDGKRWELRIENGKMLIGPEGVALHEGQMKYIGWDDKIWRADLVRMIDLHSDLD
jgi:hypothetical protein